MYLMDAVQHYHYFWMTVFFIVQKIPLTSSMAELIPPLGVIEGSGAKHHGGNLGADG